MQNGVTHALPCGPAYTTAPSALLFNRARQISSRHSGETKPDGVVTLVDRQRVAEAGRDC